MSDQRLRTAAVALCGAGVAIAAYLTWVHYAALSPICVGGGGGCERVQNSSYAEIVGVPVALIGLLGYAALLVLSLGRGENARMLAAAGSVVAVGFSAYLTYLELFVIHSICQWCVASALVAVALCVVALARALRPGI